MTELAVFRRECADFFSMLYTEIQQTLVFGDGCSDSPPLMLIGEAPGEQEVIQSCPFVGKAGRNLDEFLRMMSMPRNRIFVTNVVKIRPTQKGTGKRMRNRAPSSKEIAAFLPWLNREIELVSPRALVTLGNVPLKSLMGKNAVIGNMHGQWHTAQNGRPLYALYHPASIIYRRELMEVYKQDVLHLCDTIGDH